MSDMNHKDHHEAEHEHHIVPLKTYWLVLIALLILTVITVGASYINFGSAAYNWAVAIAIASAKASLVMFVFMGLRWDSNANRIAMFSGFIALIVFVWLASADLWFRVPERPVAVKKAAAVVGMSDIKTFEANAGAEVLARGKTLYAQNCASCHGVDGGGDGAAGAALNPKPHNFKDAAKPWKNGGSAKAIYITLAEGIKGSGMAAYPSLSVEDRWSLVHYVRSITASVPATSEADKRFAEVLEKVDGVGPNAVVRETIPVDLAIELMLKDK
jgi:caa(3)-type oxidase subunit IV